MFALHWRRTWMLGVVLLSSAACSTAQPQLVWSDEFDGTALNTSNWEYMFGDGCQFGPNLCGWGNQELQWYTSRPENVAVEDGLLKITARQDFWQGREFTSARIRTLNKADFRYGRLEARIKLPRGQGVWPAFWMLPTNSPYGDWPRSGEIDIMEAINNDNVVHGTIHFGDPKDDSGGSLTPAVNISETFNIYAVEWEPDEIRWYFNNQLYHVATSAEWYSSSTGNPQAPFNQDFHFLLNIAVGGRWPGDPDQTTVFPQQMQVDWVRVYNLCPTCPFHGAPLPIPGRVEMENFDNGGQNVSYNDADAINRGGSYRDEGVDIQVSTEGGHNVGFIEPSEWIDYSVVVNEASLYKVQPRVASDGAGGLFRLELNGAPLGDPFTAPPTGGWQTWTTLNQRISLPLGQHELRWANSEQTGGYNINYIDFYLAADVDEDFDVDFADLLPVLFCMAGPDVFTPGVPGCVGALFADADLDLDGDSDLLDASEVQRAYTGS